MHNRLEWIEHNKKIFGAKYNSEDNVSCQDNGKVRGTSSLNKELSEICKRNGLPHVTPHGLRHTYATILIEQGYSLPIVSAALGHASVTTTFETYADVMCDENKAISILNSIYPEGD